MSLSSKYIFTSTRLGFRPWSLDDLAEFALLCADAEVMEHLPKRLSTQETEDLISRLMKHQDDHGYCYFACEILESGEFIGFIGLAFQTYEAPFTPATDMGWRLKKSAWGKGYATEGAMRCMEYTFEELNLDSLVAVCTEKNYKSENVMKKIGMLRAGSFVLPSVNEPAEHIDCIWYTINKNQWKNRQ